ncbi:hypothetical protein KGO95_03930 [Patescibacteria group bacterium]|nr:hypothetical protein [Patescibacteria group bacterium]
MDARRTKQIIYGALYGLFWICIFAGVYFWSSRPVPTCYDGVQNQGEQGVDCGGPCAIACIPPNLKAISPTGGVLVFASGAGHVSLLAQVSNTNTGFASPSFDYRFDLDDASGTLVASVLGRSFIYGGEVKYLAAPNVSVNGPVDHATLSIWNVKWVDTPTMGIVPQFAVQNDGPVPSPTGTVLVAGSIKNNDLASFSSILVIGVLKSVGGLVVGTSQTTLDHIAPGASEDFTVMYPAVPGLDPSLTQFYAYALRT